MTSLNEKEESTLVKDLGITAVAIALLGLSYLVGKKSNEAAAQQAGCVKAASASFRAMGVDTSNSEVNAKIGEMCKELLEQPQ